MVRHYPSGFDSAIWSLDAQYEAMNTSVVERFPSYALHKLHTSKWHSWQVNAHNSQGNWLDFTFSLGILKQIINIYLKLGHNHMFYNLFFSLTYLIYIANYKKIVLFLSIKMAKRKQKTEFLVQDLLYKFILILYHFTINLTYPIYTNSLLCRRWTL
jgi:hypothetical protein